MSRLLQSLIVCVALLMPANELSAQGIRDSIELEPVVVRLYRTGAGCGDSYPFA